MKKLCAFVLVLAMSMSLLASCGSTDENEISATTDSATTDSTTTNPAITEPTTTEPDGIVPGSSASFYSGADVVTMLCPGSAPMATWLYSMLYDTLFYSPSGSWDDITGLLVKDYALSEDGLVWTLNLYENATFANGKPVNAPAVQTASWVGQWDMQSSNGGLGQFFYSSSIIMSFGETGMHDFCRDPELDPVLWELVDEGFTQLTREDTMDVLLEMLQILDDEYAYLCNVRAPR